MIYLCVGIELGAPQGPVLAPFFFTLYTTGFIITATFKNTLKQEVQTFGKEGHT